MSLSSLEFREKHRGNVHCVPNKMSLGIPKHNQVSADAFIDSDVGHSKRGMHAFPHVTVGKKADTRISMKRNTYTLTYLHARLSPPSIWHTPGVAANEVHSVVC